MIDAIPATAARAPLQSAQLRHQAGLIQQVDLARVQTGKEVPVNVGLGASGGVIGDAVLLEDLAGPLACIAVTLNLCDPVPLEEIAEVLHDGFRAERGLALPDGVEDGDLAFLLALPMTNRERHAVSRAT